MRGKYEQMSLFDTYKSLENDLENDQPKFLRLLEEHLDWSEIIPGDFYCAFHRRFGRSRKYGLESFLRALFLQRVFHYTEDTQLLNTLRFSREMRDYCGFVRVPDASKITRFKQDFCDQIRKVFDCLVELTEPICREMDEALADMLIFDTTGIESYVAENNPKFYGLKEQQLRYLAQNAPSFDPSRGAVALFPSVAASNPAVKQQYINGHFCYAQKAVVLANGLGIVRHLELMDEDFRQKHPEMPREKRTRDPTVDKEIGDSTALRPIMQDFRAIHPSFHYSVFSGDGAFDSYDNYTLLLKEFQFAKAVIPLGRKTPNPSTHENFNERGTPLCPKDGTPFRFHSRSGGKHRSKRIKFICPKSRSTRLENGKMSWRSTCKTPCSSSKYGKTVYVYPDKNLRLYPGIARDSEEFAVLYNRRAGVERSISSLKEILCLQGRKTSNVLTTKSDLFLAGIVQLLCVLLAHRIHQPELARRTRLLLAA